MKLIIAVDSKGGIAKNGQIPWRNKEDLKHFKKHTLNQTVVMGRKTFESIGRVLPRRRNIVITTKPPIGVKNPEYMTLETFLEQAVGNEWVIGGAQLYKSLKPFITQVVLSKIQGDYECDTFLPKLPDTLSRIREVCKGDFTVVYYF